MFLCFVSFFPSLSLLLCMSLKYFWDFFFYSSFLLTGSKSWFTNQSLQPKLVKSWLLRLECPQSSSSYENSQVEFIGTFQSPTICLKTSSVSWICQFYWGGVTNSSQEAPPNIFRNLIYGGFITENWELVSIREEEVEKLALCHSCDRAHVCDARQESQRPGLLHKSAL